MRHFSLLLAFLISTFALFGQNNSEVEYIRTYKNATKEQKWETLHNLFNYYYKTNLKKADSLKKEYLMLSMESSTYAEMKCKEQIAFLECNFGNNKPYYEFFKKSRAYLNLMQTEAHKNEALYNIGIQLNIEKKYDSTSLIAKQLIIKAKKRKNYDLVAKTYTLLGLTKGKMCEKDSMYYYFEESLPYAKRAQDKIHLMRLYNKFSNALKKEKRIDKALKYELLALEIALKNSLTYYEAAYANKIGLMQKLSDNNKEALYYYKLSAEKAKNAQSDRLLAIVSGNIGNTYKDMGNYQEAIPYHLRSIELYGKVENIKGLGEANTNLGLVYHKLGRYNDAIKQYKIALEHFSDVKNEERISHALHNMGLTYNKMGKNKKALPILNRALKIKLDSNFSSVYCTYEALSNVHGQLDNYAKAYDYLNIYHQYTDSVYKSETIEKLAQLSAQYRAEKSFEKIQEQKVRLEKQQKEKEIKEKELEVTELKNNQKTYIIIGILLVTLLISSLAFARYKQARLREQRKEAELNQSLLRTQMNPHFIFNAMSVIQSYIYDNDIKNSSRFLVNFSKLMRLILENSPKEFIPIKIENDILNKYLIIQKLRFEDRFDFKIEVDPILLDQEALIPPMLTQPFIENAIEHGQLHDMKEGIIKIKFLSYKSKLKIEIIDNGIGRDKSKASEKGSAHKSMAMQITRNRINLMNTKYKSDGYMKVEDANQEKKSGTHITLVIPLHTKVKPLNA